MKGGITALMIASRHPKGFEIAELLLSFGADVNAINDFGTSALHEALFKDN